MCGRINQHKAPRGWAEKYGVFRELKLEWNPRYNIAPTQAVLCIRDADEREFFTPRWGLIPSWAKDDMMAELHDRMPVILPMDEIDQWLDPKLVDPEKIKPLLLQYPSDDMQAWQVGKEVGNVRNQGPQLMEPVT